jgi:rSAM/selenodomain-associated transferase 1
MRPAQHVVIFLRAPRLGRVKSRLARGIGAVAAVRFYRNTVSALLRRLTRDPRWKSVLAVTPDIDLRRRPWRVPARYRSQGNGDLGERMARVFRDLPPGPAIIIGSDIPALGPAHIAAAFKALGNHDVVFGPASDGGYWLVGLRRRPRLPPRLFRGVRWSSAQALGDTLAGLPRDLSIAFLETLEDIDDAESYARWRRAVALSRPRASDARSIAASARPGCTGGAGCRADA